jgi:hypothetical protein
VPTGGTTDQALIKISATNFATTWGGPFLALTGGTLTGALTGTTLTLTGGSLTLQATNTVINMNKTAGANGNYIQGNVGSSARWQMILGTNTTESGSNVGSDFQLSRYTDAGGFVDAPFSILRSNGQVSINVPTGQLAANQTQITAPSGTQRALVGATNSSNRWSVVLASNGAEGGSNSGSDFAITRFSDAAASLGSAISIVRSTGVATFSAAIVNGPSDRSLKENISPLEGSLKKVLALQGVSFNLIGERGREIGLIAQDVAPVVPEVIQPFNLPEQEKKTLLAIDYPKLVALLIEAIKELSARVEVLEG